MSEERRRDRRPFVAILIAAILAAILVIGAWLWVASQPVPIPTHDVNPPQVFWSHDPTVPGDEIRDAGPFVGLAYRMLPDSFDARADRLYAATPERLYAFETSGGRGGRNAWGTLHHFNVSEGATRRTITAGPVAVNYGDFGGGTPDYEIYLGTDDGSLFLLRDAGNAPPTGDAVRRLQLEGAVTGLAAYSADMWGGSTVRGNLDHVAFDGASWVRTTVSATMDFGEFASLALSPAGVPYVAYYDHSSGRPFVAHGDSNSTYWLVLRELEPVTGNAGLFTSLAMDSTGLPRVAYYDETFGALVYAAWSGFDWIAQYVEVGSGVGPYASLALDPATGYPRIAYDGPGSSLRYAAWDGASWSIESVEEGGTSGHISLALTSSGEPRIAFLNGTTQRLMYAAKVGPSWVREKVSDFAPLVPLFSSFPLREVSLALNATDGPHVAYHNETGGSLEYAVKSGGSWQVQVVDAGEDVGHYPSIAIGPGERPAIAYTDAGTVDLRYATWTGSAWDVETVLSEGYVGLYASLAFDSAGRPHVASYSFVPGRSERDVVVAGTASGKLYGISAGIPETIERLPREKRVLATSPRVQWTLDVGAEVHLAGGPLESVTNIPLYSPAFASDGGQVFAGLETAEILAVDVGTGEIAWRQTIPGAAWHSAPVAYLDAQWNRERVLAAGDDGTVSVYDLSGTRMGTRGVASGGLRTPVAGLGGIALASDTGEILHVAFADTPGAPTWTGRLVGPSSRSVDAIPERDLVVFGDETGRLYAYRLMSGALVYRAKLCDRVTAGPIVGFVPQSFEANVWFGCQDGRLFAVSSAGAPRAVP